MYLLFCEELKATKKELDRIMQSPEVVKIDLHERVFLQFATGLSFKVVFLFGFHLDIIAHFPVVLV